MRHEDVRLSGISRPTEQGDICLVPAEKFLPGKLPKGKLSKRRKQMNNDQLKMLQQSIARVNQGSSSECKQAPLKIRLIQPCSVDPLRMISYK